jgi:cytochrome c oxidase assembly protein subunit 15
MRGSDLLAVGFGTTVAMWTAGYVCRLPFVQAPAPVVLALLLACALGGGVLLGRTTDRGTRGGLAAGTIVGLLNLLVLGSLLSGDRPNEVLPSALLWAPGSIAVSALLLALGTALGKRGPVRPREPSSFLAAFAWVAAAATLLLLGVGGLVTSHEAGLAVADWPSSFGYSMFLYPLSRMTGGVYYEHAHRLFGSLVGLTTVVLAIQIHRVDPRRGVRLLALTAAVLVMVQGVLGGLRVTETSLGLAVLHGILGQVFFAVVVALAVTTTKRWREARAADRRGLPSGMALLGLLLIQITLGAVQRHLSAGLAVHLILAAIIAPMAISHGIRTWGLHPQEPLLGRLGKALVAITALQVALGLGAWVATGAAGATHVDPVWDVTLATAHQWCGAILLAWVVMLVLWTHRLALPASSPSVRDGAIAT